MDEMISKAELLRYCEERAEKAFTAYKELNGSRTRSKGALVDTLSEMRRLFQETNAYRTLYPAFIEEFCKNNKTEKD